VDSCATARNHAKSDGGRLLGSGLRLGELVGLDQGDLMLEAGFVRIRHTPTLKSERCRLG
jgi:site-specific recombinase XerC